MRKYIFIATSIFIGLGIGYLLNTFFLNKEVDYKVLNELPFQIEKRNPVPEVRHWDLGDKTYYYFNWGLKPTNGYDLELITVERNLIKIKALTPAKDQMLIEMLTFPHLFLALPKGRYRYVVIDKNTRLQKDIFTPKYRPLRMTIFLPQDDDHVTRREILRDPNFNNNQYRNSALIALEALFNQEEMIEFVDLDIFPESATFSEKEGKWYILLSKGYDNLGPGGKLFLKNLITKTIQTIKQEKPIPVEVTTASSKLSSSSNQTTDNIQPNK